MVVLRVDTQDDCTHVRAQDDCTHVGEQDDQQSSDQEEWEGEVQGSGIRVEELSQTARQVSRQVGHHPPIAPRLCCQSLKNENCSAVTCECVRLDMNPGHQTHVLLIVSPALCTGDARCIVC